MDAAEWSLVALAVMVGVWAVMMAWYLARGFKRKWKYSTRAHCPQCRAPLEVSCQQTYTQGDIRHWWSIERRQW